jgi:hypothetical protein
MAGLVGFALLWPIAHAGLVARFGIDPWELFGWSMYATPAARVQIRIEVEREGESKPLRAMGELRQHVQDFARRRTALGSLASTEPLAETILALDPTIEATTIWIREILLDPITTHLVPRERAHRHDRESVDASLPAAPRQIGMHPGDKTQSRADQLRSG